MTKFVRVELENGSIASVPEDVAKGAGLEPLDVPALDQRGRPLDVEYPDVAPEGYESLSKERLHDLVDARNASRDEGDQLSKSGTKADLAARLTEDDTNPTTAA